MLLLLIYHCHLLMLSALCEVTLFFDIIRVYSFGLSLLCCFTAND